MSKYYEIWTFPPFDQNEDRFIENSTEQNFIGAATLSGSFREYSTKPLHNHPFHQILRIRDGVTLLVGEDQKLPLFGNMTAFIPADFCHRSVVIGGQISYKSLYLRRNLFGQGEGKIRIFDISELGNALFNKMEFPWDQQPSSPLMETCLSLFLKTLDEDLPHSSPVLSLPSASDPSNQKIIEFVENNYQKRLKLPDFIAISPYSARHISRLFKQDLQMTIMEYLKLNRILMSAVMLQTENISITEIAYECGYESLSCFYTDFGNILSTTPKAFRQQIQTNAW